MRLIKVREMAYYDTVAIEPNANPEDLKKAFEKLIIQCPPEDEPNRNKWFRKYDPIKQEDDRGGDEMDVIKGKRHRVGSFRNATPSYRKKNRTQMARMILVSQLRRVEVLEHGFNHRAVIQTTVAPCNQVGNFIGIEGMVTVMFVPMYNNVDISEHCRLLCEDGRGHYLDNCLIFKHTVRPTTRAYDFGRIFLSWGGDREQLDFNITIRAFVTQHRNRDLRHLSQSEVVVQVLLPGWNNQAPQNAIQQQVPFGHHFRHHFAYPVQHAAPIYAPQRFPMFPALANAQPNQQQAGKNVNAGNVGPNRIWSPEYGITICNC